MHGRLRNLIKFYAGPSGAVVKPNCRYISPDAALLARNKIFILMALAVKELAAAPLLPVLAHLSAANAAAAAATAVQTQQSVS